MEATIPLSNQQRMADLSLAIESLSEDEIYESVYGFYLKKLAKAKETAYWDSVYKVREYPKFSAEELYKNVASMGRKEIPGFKIGVHEKKVYRLLALYFTQDSRFEDEGYSLRKGIYLFGNIGCGKTTAMQLFRRNQHQSFVVNRSRDISAEFTAEGNAGIEKYYKLLKPSNRDMYFGQEFLGRCFDDIGVENIASNYGNKISVMTELIMGIYNRDQHLQNYNTTHFTSNCELKDLQALYGDRVVSRIAEMTNIIQCPSDSQDKRTFSTGK